MMPRISLDCPQKGACLVVSKPNVISWTGVDPSLFVSLSVYNRRKHYHKELLASGIVSTASFTWIPDVWGSEFCIGLEARHGINSEVTRCYSGDFSIRTQWEAATLEELSIWLPEDTVGLISAFTTPVGLEAEEASICSVGFSKEIRWHGGDPSWAIRLVLVDYDPQVQVEVMAQDLPNTSQFFSSLYETVGSFQVRIEAYDEEGQLQDFCCSSPFGVVDDGERELDEHALKLMDLLDPSRPAVVVEGRLGGAFNSIVMLRRGGSDLVLRTRRGWPLSDIVFENITATQTVVQELKLPFAVPRLERYDATVNNPVGRQYWLQSRVPGVALSQVIDSLTAPQRVFLAQEVARCMTAINNAKKFAHCGGFVRHPNNGAAVVGCPLYFQRVEDEPRAGYYEFMHFVPNPSTNLYSFLKRNFQAVAESSEQPHFKYFWKAAEQKLKQFGRRSYRANRLVHTDFFPRNILVTLTDQPRITGVVDWDQCEVLPPELACITNPGWLWSGEGEPLNGYDLTLQAADADSEAVRLAFLREMERLRPGYSARVRRSQQCSLGIFGGLSLYGLDEGDNHNAIAYLIAGLELVKEQGLLEAFYAEKSRN